MRMSTEFDDSNLLGCYAVFSGNVSVGKYLPTFRKFPTSSGRNT